MEELEVFSKLEEISAVTQYGDLCRTVRISPFRFIE